LPRPAGRPDPKPPISRASLFIEIVWKPGGCRDPHCL
jgi:hypothetical protein